MSNLSRANRLLWLFGRFKVPLIGHVGPRLVALTDQEVVVRVPLRRRTRNHWKTMYFGSLAVGADVAGGFLAIAAAEEARKRTGRTVTFVFKDVTGDFLRRPDGHVHFTCRDGAAIRQAVERTLASGERENLPVEVTCTVPDNTGDEPVARFTLTLSLKAK